MKKLLAATITIVALGGCSLFKASAPELAECFAEPDAQSKSINLDSAVCKYQALKPVLTESGACEVIRGEKTIGEFLKELEPELALKVAADFVACDAK